MIRYINNSYEAKLTSYSLKNDEIINKTIEIQYESTLIDLLRFILKEDKYVSQVLVIKDNIVIPLSRYNEILSNGVYVISFPQKNKDPYRYEISINY